MCISAHPRAARMLLAGILLVMAPDLGAAEPVGTRPPDGLRDRTPRLHALVGGRIIVAPGKVIPEGTLVIRDELIEAVGAELAVPPGARVWNLQGKTIYPGLIDLYSEIPPGEIRGRDGPRHWNPNINADVAVGADYRPQLDLNKAYRANGITARLAAPPNGIVKGSSALVACGDGAASESVILPFAAMHMRLMPDRGGSREVYPNSPMGAVALVRQVLYDARWYGQAWRAFQTRDRVARPQRDEALEVLQAYPDSALPVFVDAPNELYALRADRLGSEFGLNVVIRGSGYEYRRAQAIAATGRAVVVPLNFPKPPDVRDPAAALSVSLEKLLHWDFAPENPARLAAAGVRIALTAHGLKDQQQFLPNLRRAVARGLNPDAALQALTIAPTEVIGVSGRLGSLEPGKLAHLVVVEGDLFAAEGKILETWIDGRRYDVARLPQTDVRGTWEFSVGRNETGPEQVVISIEGEATKPKATLRRADKSAQARAVLWDGTTLSLVAPGAELGWPGLVRLSVTVSLTAAEGMTCLGDVAWPDGAILAANGRRTSEQPLPPAASRVDDAPPVGDSESGGPRAEKKAMPGPDSAEPKPASQSAPDGEADGAQKLRPADQPALFNVVFPLGDYGRDKPPEQPAKVLFRDATIWTAGPEGTLAKGSLLIEHGRITAVGEQLAIPDDAFVIDASGKHISPGIVDCHSHIATDGGVNEAAQAVTAEVRIGDFIDCDDIQIYRQLAGGVTTSNILHGSANPIGGQNQVIKLRWGLLPEELKFAEAPPGIKFALGENVKQSNWGERFTSRYPQTRMGVEQIVRDEFEAAKAYRRNWERWRRGPSGLPPRYDLELEAVAEILERKRLIHCHSYRQDEILAFLRTCEDFGVRIGTLQHILEGYKVAEHIARHQAGASSFSDWWAYKVEVFDAIPYNGPLMQQAGIVVSYNSDDAEMARRLNQEAAKAVKYGGLSADDALRFVTLNPARQLGIADRVGSLEVGKDADFVVWSGDPLSVYSHCEQTWIDGRRYFDRTEDQQMRTRAESQRAALTQRILALGEPYETPDEAQFDVRALWPREDIYCGHGHDHDHGEHD